VYLWLYDSHPEVQTPEVNMTLNISVLAAADMTTARPPAANPRVCIEKYHQKQLHQKELTGDDTLHQLT